MQFENSFKPGTRVLYREEKREGEVITIAHRSGSLWYVYVLLDAKSFFHGQCSKWIYEGDLAIIGYPEGDK